MNHLPGRGMGPLPIINRVGKDHQQMESSCYIRSPKYPWPAIYGEMNGCRIRLLPGGHRVVKIDEHSRVVKRTRGYEWLQGVPLH